MPASKLDTVSRAVPPAQGAIVPASVVPIPRYTALAQALHWATSALVLAVLPLAWVATALPRDSGWKPAMFQFHKSVGLTLLALVVARILWRALHPPPPEATEPPALALLAKASHWLLYAIFLIMPVSGYLLSAYNGSTTQYFYLFAIPGFEKDPALHDAFKGMHLVGQWAVYALVGLHVAATAWHVAMRRDYVLERMLPEQDPRTLRRGR